jgi:thiamine kinase-like enzyme
LDDEKNIINGLECKNIINYIKELPRCLIENEIFVKFHGDFILDNIIKTKDSYKLIDWRHEFDNQLYYGDIYYELSKIRHNLIFNHSNILNNMFTVEYRENEVIVDLKCNYFLIEQLNDFERFVIENNYDLTKIKIITSLIWLNMSPLYEGKLSEFLFYFGKYNLFIQL